MENERYKNLRTGIFFSGRRYFCALELALELIGGKWKPMMLYHLKNGPLRSSDLQGKLNNISNKMFTQTARDLEHVGMISRKVFQVSPPKVEYSLTPLGDSVIPVIMQLGYWGESIGEYEEQQT